MKHLVEEPGKSHFCKIEKTRFKVSKVIQRVVPKTSDFLQKFVPDMCTGRLIQYSSQFEFHTQKKKCYINTIKIMF